MSYHIYLLSNCVEDSNVVKIETTKIDSKIIDKLDFTGVLVFYQINNPVESEVIQEFKKQFNTTKYGDEYFSGDINSMVITFSDIIKKYLQSNIITKSPILPNMADLLFTDEIDAYVKYTIENTKNNNKEHFDLKSNYPDKINIAKIKIVNELYDISKKTKYTIKEFDQIVNIHIKLGYLAEFYKIHNIDYNLSIENSSLNSFKKIIIDILRPKQEIKDYIQLNKNHLDLITDLQGLDVKMSPYQIIEYLSNTLTINKTLYNPDKKFVHDHIHDQIIKIDLFTSETLKIKHLIITCINIRMLVKVLDKQNDNDYITALYKYLHKCYTLIGNFY